MWLALLALSGGWVAACEESDYPQSLELAGVGTVYVGDLRFDAASGSAELFNGLCFVSEGEGAWTISASRMWVEDIQGTPRFVAEAATLELGETRVFAEGLENAQNGFSMSGVEFSSPRFSGTAERAFYDLTQDSAQGSTLGSTLGRNTLEEVRLRLGSFWVTSASATLTERALVLNSVRATTCLCDGGGLYALRAPVVRIDFQSGVVRVQGGVLETLGLHVALDPNLQLRLDGPPRPGQPGLNAGFNLGGATLLPTPAAPEPVGETIDEGSKLSLPIQLLPGAALELGAAGLDDDHPFGLVSLLQLGEGNVRAALGRVGPGVRADLLVRRPLAPGVGLDFSLTNRHWQEAGFLHEGSLGLYAGRQLVGVLGELSDTLALGAQAFSAFSSQRLVSGRVLSPRLGVRGSAVYTLSPLRADTLSLGTLSLGTLSLGTLSLRTEGTLTHYPGVLPGDALTQFSARFVPSWRSSFGPLRTDLSFDQQFTNGASPFSLSFDRLEPRSLLSASAEVALPAWRVGVRGRYNLLFAAEGRAPLRLLRLHARRDLAWSGGSADARLEAEFAGLLGPPDPDVGAFIGAQSDFSFVDSELELGLRGRYNPLASSSGGAPALELLEVSASYPLTLSDVTLRPFLALNAAPLLTGGSQPALSGYGLELAVKSCCGTLSASYRLHGGAVSTAFDMQLVPGPEFRP